MEVYDFLQGPMSNLANSYNLSDFDFPYTYDYLAAPLNTIQQQYYTFLVNALYVAIPNFRMLYYQVLSPINEKNVDRSLFPIVLNIMMLVGLTFGMTVLMVVTYRVRRARTTVHRLLEALGAEHIQQKKGSVQEFMLKYSVLEEEPAESTEKPTMPFMSHRQN
jgi:hypothetical protein